MQIHELNPYIGKPGAGDVIAIDDGRETTKIELAAAVEELLPPPTPKANLIWYGTCGTAAETTAKTVTCAGFELVTGATIAVKFSNTNTMTAPTLNVNSTGAVAIKRKSGGTESLVGLWNAGSVLMFTYDGTNWIVDNAPGETDTGWQTLNNNVRYRKIGKVIFVKINNGNSVQLVKAGTQLGTVPAGFRPPNQTDAAGTPLGGPEAVFFRVETNGVIKGFASSPTLYFTGIFSYPEA